MKHSGEFEIRCPKCNRLLGYIDGRAEIKCPRCRTATVEVATAIGKPPKIKIKSADKSTE